MKRYIWWIVIAVILTGGIILCTARWDAWFSNPDEPEWNKDTIDYHFYTFGQDSIPGWTKENGVWADTIEPDILRFVVLGDVHNSMDSVQWRSIVNRHPNLDFYAQAGDFLERSYGYYAQQLFHELRGTGFDSMVIVNCPGNHEYMKGVVRTLPPLWEQMFVHPTNGPLRFVGSTYFVDLPRLRFIVLDTNGLQRLSDYTILYTWLSQALKDAGERFTIVMMHHPVYSYAKGRQNVMINLSFRSVLQQADLVFAGHDHNYARRLPFVVTNSAKKFYPIKNNVSDARICSEHQLYEYLTIQADTLSMQTILTDIGEVFDEVRIVRHGSETEIIDLSAKSDETISCASKAEAIEK